ncbi:hypothetical protein SAMN06295905_0691 [Devosia lucknowensis]|uniref:Porin n=1 Tax=Devosia lucknowensis TaxID=1096929 RepID=A0A1Y6EQZ1_9HYPH|nr:hypothetical protein [Devosia lucknowensis]SMQ62603.1 hypothetical protein SAMN06295905_0691 [Devosia lucknowensis]
MKLKSLILGSVAAAGLSTAGYAADLGVLTSLDVCDSLGISGLTISSSDNCLQITGGVSYEFNWGDFNGSANTIASNAGGLAADNVTVPDNDTVAGLDNDWNSKVETWLKFVGTASSDFGPASATIKLKSVHHFNAPNEVVAVGGDATGGVALGGVVPAGLTASGNGIWIVDEAFVSVGDTTTIMAGKKGSIANFGDDVPLNFLGLFNSENVDTGVMFAKNSIRTGGHSIQVVSTVADGLTLKAGLENLGGDSAAAGNNGYAALTQGQSAGSAVGVIEYAGNGIKAHVTGLAGGILDGVVENWGVHAGFTGTFDAFTVVGAGAYGANNAGVNYWNVLGSAKAQFDIFEIALSGEANGGSASPSQAGFGGSVGATVTEGVKLNLGGRWFDEDTAVANNESYQIAAQIVAAVAETITVTGEVGYYGTNKPAPAENDFYGAAELAWAPGGGFTSSVKGQVHQTGAYKVTFKAAKEFK